MDRNEYILKLKNLKSIIDKQLLIESENDKWYNAHSSEVQKEINFCKRCKTASPRELQSHIESASELLTPENYKVLKELGPKVQVDSPEQADYLNKATKALKKLSEKVKNNYHLESSNGKTVVIITSCILILISAILCALFGRKLMNNIFQFISNLMTPGRDGGDSALDSYIKLYIHFNLLGLCVLPGIIGMYLLIGVFFFDTIVKALNSLNQGIIDFLKDKTYVSNNTNTNP